ncbi:DUF5343 domain-containing protein [Actinophytocola sp. KF-1]
MANDGIPYVMAYGYITKTLDAVQRAQTPDRFTQDFLATRLNIKGGTAKAVIPFLKKTGFLSSDGTPTELYKQFRNEAQAGSAAATALRTGFNRLYEMDERVHELSDDKLKGLIIQASGVEGSSSTLQAMVGSFKTLRAYANFDQPNLTADEDDEPETNPRTTIQPSSSSSNAVHTPTGRINLGYTINLNLPATSDVAVFDAIFTSLHQHLMS